MNEFMTKLIKSNHFKCSTKEKKIQMNTEEEKISPSQNTVNQEYQIVRIEDQLQN